MLNTKRCILHNAECCQGEQGLRKKGRGGGWKKKSILERKAGTTDVKRGREEIWKGIREREQLIRRGKQRDGESEREGRIRAGTYERGKKTSGSIRERDNNQRGRRERGKCQKRGGWKDFG